MSKTTILVTGANGQVGQELRFLATLNDDFQFIFTSRTELDITNNQAVNDFFLEHSINYCLNCAAYTAVDKAEEENKLAYMVNVEGTKNLAQACLTYQANLIHLSTDYVYHTDHHKPYKETDRTSPKTVYAQTKLEGEQAATTLLPETIIIRTSWVYSSYGNNFVKTMLRLGRKLDSLRVIFDQIGTPTYARDLAQAMLDIVQKTQHLESFGGIYHYSNEGVTSWYDFATAIFDMENITCPITPIETKDYPTPAKRPHFSVLNKTKIKAAFNLTIPHWRVSLKACLKELE